MLFRLLLLFPLFLCADPFGKDADLVKRKKIPPCLEQEQNPGVALSTLLIRFHQEVISPADGPRSHFFPSSSQYTLEAIQKYGFFKGWALGCDRLMRENDDPWVYRKGIAPSGDVMKFDPIPFECYK